MAAAAAAGSQHCCVFVGNIPYDATEEQLIQICEEVGPVVSFRLVLDRETGKPKGYGFCEYKDEETALSARRNLQGYEINGRQLRVDFAENDKGADRNREQGRGGPGFTSTNDAHKPPVIGDSSLHQPMGHPLAVSAASSMARVLGGRLPSGLQNLSGLRNDSLTQYLAKMSREQMNEIMSEMKAFAVQNKALAKQLLQGCPQLLTALFQAQIMLGMVTPQMMQMANNRQSSSSIPQHALQNSIPNQSPLLHSHLGQTQASSASQNPVMLQQSSIPLQQLPVQPSYQHPLPMQPQILVQGTASGKSGIPHHQNFGSLPNQPQLPPLPTSKSLMSQVQLPVLQHSRTHGATNIVQQPQPHVPDNLHQTNLPTPLTTQSGSSNYPALPSGLNSLSTEARPYASHDLTWASRGSTHSTSGVGLAAQTGTTGEPSEVMSHRSKRQKTEDGGRPHFTMTDTFSTISSVPVESLADLDSSLKKLGSRLLILKGDPVGVLPRILEDWNIGKLWFEFDTEPYGRARDNKVKDFASARGIKVFSPTSHTLFDPAAIIEKNGGKPPLTYQSFVALAGEPPPPIIRTYTVLPPIGDLRGYEPLNVPTLRDLGYTDVAQEEFSPFRGGESEALKRLKESLADKEWVANFEKPKGDPSAFIQPSTTILSPYLKFGCLSSRHFYQCLIDVYRSVKKHTSPPVSLVGQLLWRDFFYTVAFGTPNFDNMRGNKICKQIPWKDDEKLLEAWREGRTGYPWIDASMIQLKKWGWMHHLARHSVACFLTRGDLFLHWKKGRDVFERLLIDSDWAINNGNWLWLSCSSFFHQYHRIYSPISFGRKYDPTGKYIRHFLPVLKNLPDKYIYEPWTAPLTIQENANCIIGRDYPTPVVDHNSASKECRRRMGAAYALKVSCDTLSSEETLENLRRKLEEGDQKEFQDTGLKQQKRRIK